MSFISKQIEQKWQKAWSKQKVFDAKKSGKKYYCLEMFPYPSGKLHMGHVRNYAIGDAIARYKRMNGFNVLHPMGFDSFGLPAENAAIKEKVEPKKWTEEKILQMTSQQKELGFSYDWSTKICTHSPEYYKWNQWIFLQFLKKCLAYKKKAPVNWCENCKTVLANEQVVNGKCWRCENEVKIKELNQWFFKISKYSEELLKDLDKLKEWPQKVKTMQKNWIGKSTGVNFKQIVKDLNIKFEVFDSVPQTFIAQTFTVIAPEHPMVEKLVKGTKFEAPVKEFVERIKKKKSIGKFDVEKDLEGIFSGRFVKNPFGKGDFPIWVASFVLAEYGTGIVNSSAHDERDFAFAKKYGIPLRIAMLPTDKKIGERVKNLEFCYSKVDEGIIQEPEEFKGMSWQESREGIIKYIEKKGFGKKATNYKLRDWLLSRQRFWGTPIPVVYCTKCGMVPVKEKDLPVLLPKNAHFSGKGNPLEEVEEFVKTKCPKCRGSAKRETDTMDTFVDSSWYFLRYCSPQEKKLPFEKKRVGYWMPVDQYIGGIEHAVMHLLYARFFTKALRDLKLLNFGEPFKRLLAQGMVLNKGVKMSKSFGNTVSPEEISNKFGSDTARLFMMGSALPEKELEWSDKGVEATYRFLKKVFKLFEANKKNAKFGKINKQNLGFADKLVLSKTHKAIKNISEQIDAFEFNYAITEIMQLVNLLARSEKLEKNVLGFSLKTICLLLNPFAPYLSEELWKKLGQKGLSSIQKWPSFSKKFVDAKVEQADEFVKTVKEDIYKIKELAKISKPKKITIFVSPKWKFDALKILKKKKIERPDVSLVIKELMTEEKMRKLGKEVLVFAKQIAGKLPEYFSSVPINEAGVLKEFSLKLEKEFETRVEVLDAIKAEGEKTQKAKNALPLKPAIYLE